MIFSYRDPKKAILQKLEVIALVILLPLLIISATLGINKYNKIHCVEKHFDLAKKLHCANDIKGAISELEKCIETDNQFFPAYDALASIYYITGRKDKTLEIYLEAVKNNPESAEACIEAGKIFYINKDFEKARNYFLAARRLDTDNDNKAFLDKMDEKINYPAAKLRGIQSQNKSCQE